MVLDAILATKRAELVARKALTPVSQLVEGITPSDRDFVTALEARRPAFILEIKPASPSEGRLRDPDELGPAIATYGRHADVISVLTDQPYFSGSFELLRAVHSAVSQPVLCKDFFLEPYQVYEARRAGADAILLMLSVLDDDGYRACAEVAGRLGMGVLTEAHSPGEMARAAALGAAVIGINNRNLSTLAVDLATTPALADAAPPDAIVIAESGIRSRSDVRRLAPLVDGFLIGTTLMRAADVDRTARRLLYGSTKVCGLTRPADAAFAAQAGATHGGLIFARESPRALSTKQAVAVRDAAPLDWVGVFVNETVDQVARVSAGLGLAAVQLHGEETTAMIRALRTRLAPGCEIWKAVRVRDRIPAAAELAVDRVLLDGWHPDRRGGTGQPFDWNLLDHLADGHRYVLSGGLKPANVALAASTPIEFFDVNSGVETAPGEKSALALARFFAARRETPGPHGAIR